jgi:hypothetical protein
MTDSQDIENEGWWMTVRYDCGRVAVYLLGQHGVMVKGGETLWFPILPHGFMKRVFRDFMPKDEHITGVHDMKIEWGQKPSLVVPHENPVKWREENTALIHEGGE